MSTALLLGVDVGTYETKASLVTTDGELVATAARAHRVDTPQPGWAEHDAQVAWWDGFVLATREVVGRRPADSTVAAMAVSGIGPCVLPVDDQLHPLRPAILYGIDTRAVQQQQRLTDLLGESTLMERCWNTLSSQSAGPKILWVAEREPDVAARATAYLTCQSWLVARLTGRLVVDHLTASYSHPLYNMNEQRWDLSDLHDVVAAEQLPEIGWATDVAGTLASKVAEQFGLPTGIPVAVGTADAPAEAIAAGVRDPGEAMLMYGSSGFVIAPVATPRPDRSYYTAPGLKPGDWIHAAGTSTAGTATRWALGLAGLTDNAAGFVALVELATASPAGAAGLLFLPHLAGERTPVNDPASTAAMVGLTLRHTRADLARAVLEGIAHSQIWALETIAPGTPPESVVAIGGGAANHVWVQAVSDILGRPQRVVQSPGASFGDAWIAGVAAGLLDPTSRWPVAGHMVEPHAALHDEYRRAHNRYRALYQALRDIRTEIA